MASCRAGVRDSPMKRKQVHILKYSRLYHQNPNPELCRISNSMRAYVFHTTQVELETVRSERGTKSLSRSRTCGSELSDVCHAILMCITQAEELPTVQY